MLTFDSATHAYAYEGRPVPSVTQVIASAGLVPGVDWMSEYARDRGSAVHKACELDDLGTLDEATVDDVVKPYLFAWRAFKVAYRLECEGIERQVFHGTYGYAGTIDRVATITPPGLRSRRVVLDIKTGVPARATGVQLAAYLAAAAMPRDTHRLALHLSAEGKFLFRYYTAPTDLAVFLAALTIMNWKAQA